MPRLIVGLGNWTAVGRRTPHNFGRAVCARLCGEDGEGAGWGWWWGALCWHRTLDGHPDVTVVLPALPVNLSGWCVRRAVDALGGACEVLVVADDLRVPFGTVRTASRLSGAHNGVKSVAAALGTDAAKVVRVGADRGPDLQPCRGVLTVLTDREQADFDAKVVPAAVAAAARFVSGAW